MGKGQSMERLTYREELGVSMDKTKIALVVAYVGIAIFHQENVSILVMHLKNLPIMRI